MDLQPLIEQLGKGLAEARIAAAARLAQQSDWLRKRSEWIGVLSALLEQLGDPDSLVRSACLAALYRLGEGRLGEDFLRALDGDWTELEALLSYRTVRQRGALRAACRELASNHPSPQVRRQALRLLAWARDEEGLWPILHNLFAPEEEFPHKTEAMQALARYVLVLHALALAPLGTLLARSDWEREWRLEQLTWLLQECGRNLTLRGLGNASSWPQVVRSYLCWHYRRGWADRLSGNTGEAPRWYTEYPTWWERLLSPLMLFFTLPSKEGPPFPLQAKTTYQWIDEWRDRLLVRLGRFPSRWRRFFGWSRQTKQARRAEVRAAMLAVLHFAGGLPAETALFAALCDPDERIRKLAQQGLRQRGLEELERAVSGGLAKDPAVISLLRELSDERVKWALLFALLQGDERFRAPAAWALGEWGDSAAIPTLRWLSRPWRLVDPQIKQAALEAIAQIERLNLGRAIMLVDRPPDWLGSPERSLTLTEVADAGREQRALSEVEVPKKERLAETLGIEEIPALTVRSGESQVRGHDAEA